MYRSTSMDMSTTLPLYYCLLTKLTIIRLAWACKEKMLTLRPVGTGINDVIVLYKAFYASFEQKKFYKNAIRILHFNSLL